MNRIIKIYYKLMPYLAFLWILVCVANGIHSIGDIWHLIKPILLGYIGPFAVCWIYEELKECSEFCCNLERKIGEWVKK